MKGETLILIPHMHDLDAWYQNNNYDLFAVYEVNLVEPGFRLPKLEAILRSISAALDYTIDLNKNKKVINQFVLSQVLTTYISRKLDIASFLDRFNDLVDEKLKDQDIIIKVEEWL